LAPYESRLLMLGKAFSARVMPEREAKPLQDLSRDWTVDFPARQEQQPKIALWTDRAENRSFSGTVHYRRGLTLQNLPAGQKIWLDLGSPALLDAPQGTPARPQAQIAAPVREAAMIRINGQAVGTLWAPPYRLDITGALHKGRNEIDIMVMNGAVNALAGRPPVDRRLLTLRYGERFQDQDVDRITPQPSGLTGPITLLAE
jgi:hypothetical protein